jgi:hypothetical protein
MKTRDALDTVFAGYPVNVKGGYRKSGLIFGLKTVFLVKKNQVNFLKSFDKFRLLQTFNKT